MRRWVTLGNALQIFILLYSWKWAATHPCHLVCCYLLTQSLKHALTLHSPTLWVTDKGLVGTMTMEGRDGLHSPMPSTSRGDTTKPVVTPSCCPKSEMSSGLSWGKLHGDKLPPPLCSPDSSPHPPPLSRGTYHVNNISYLCFSSIFISW